MTLRPDQIGDRGQRYEVRWRDPEMPAGQYEAAGWTDVLADAEMIRVTMAWVPSTEIAWIADRQWAGLEEVK